jgi:uncharacterized protein DUF6335
MKRARRPRKLRPARPVGSAAGAVADFVAELERYHATSPRLTGGDLDADWRSAWDAGDEAVGGSTATPDQDIVDELGDALGVGRSPDAEVECSADILDARDRHRWTLEREAVREARAAEDDEDQPWARIPGEALERRWSVGGA